MKIVFIAFCATIGGLAAYFGQPYVRGNSDALVIIVTVLTVFAGFLVAIIAIVGDPAMIPAGSWRVAELRRETIEHRLINHVWLFIIYLIAIGILFAGVLIRGSPAPCWIKVTIERAFLFAGVTSFMLTFALPNALLKLNLGRIDMEIERRRQASGIAANVDANSSDRQPQRHF
ncbi:hypothetical protein C3941_00520 [Kaistia algarum]|uniref:hypothetical protein n=1 Tax=Kaistia algarum TaxID=2083279 RepID=UPI000CE74218|nr:hypothetical protein [Kaistia algarum]MCX5513300.1 hypothetical protein [Kaistia algarum]PPE81246.1 hypothetical protein C3941_00520 [Kaistia algarum]